MSGLSAGHGMSFPLQHNLADDTAYSMMHVPPQRPERGARQDAGSLGPAAAAAPAAPPAPPAPWGPYASPPYGWAHGYLPPFYPLAAPPQPPPPPPPMELAAFTEQRLEEIVARVVAAMLARERSALPDALHAERRNMARAGGARDGSGRIAALPPDTEQDIILAAAGNDNVPLSALPSRGLAAGVVVAIVFGAILLILFGVLIFVILTRLANPLGLVQEARDAAVSRVQGRAASRARVAAEGALGLRSKARAARRLFPSTPASGPDRWLRDALNEVES